MAAAGDSRTAVLLETPQPFSHTIDLKLTRDAIENAVPGKELALPSFQGLGRTWRVLCYLGGSKESRDDYVSLYLRLEGKGPLIRCFVQFDLCDEWYKTGCETMSIQNRFGPIVRVIFSL